MCRFLIVSAAVAAASCVWGANPYIHRVYEFCPAPGQFVNLLPEYEQGDDYSVMLSKASEQLVGGKMPGMVSLGAWGGYVVFGFDHPVVNVEGEYDFKIYGNAMISDRDKRGGSSEPGIVMVSVDANGNGLPDDEWYELAGSEYSKPSTLRGYELTYTAPGPDHTPVPDPSDKAIIDTRYISWSSNDPARPQGYVTKTAQHTQSYWPAWLPETTLSFRGTCLADNYVDVSGDGSYFVLQFYDWGYADNLPNGEDPGFDLDRAVDSQGLPVKLQSVDFIRVHTGVNQSCGRLGETSTEVCGAEDLHPQAVSVAAAVSPAPLLLLTANSPERLSVRTDTALPYCLYSVCGALAGRGELLPGDNSLDAQGLGSGVYVLRAGGATLRIMR